MPLVNYCKKCKAETPLGELCPYCNGKLAKTGEHMSFGVVRLPVKDWFSWNRNLRIGLPVILLIMIIAVVAEAITGGSRGVAELFSQGFLWTMICVLGILLLFTLVMLILQGPEHVHYVLDKQGVCARIYLRDPGDVKLYARFLTPQMVDMLEDDERSKLDGLTLVQRIELPWAHIARVSIWHKGYTLLFYRPTFWQALAVSCPLSDMQESEAYVRKKLKRFKKVKVQPLEKPISKKRS